MRETGATDGGVEVTEKATVVDAHEMAGAEKIPKTEKAAEPRVDGIKTEFTEDSNERAGTGGASNGDEAT